MKTAQVKRTEAHQRTALRAQFSPAQQLARLAKRPGDAKRERARLTKKA